MKSISLRFKSSVVSLAGNPYGKKVFREQVIPQLEDSAEYCVVFPDHIEMIASSFVQGFFSYWLPNFGIDGVLQKITVKARSQELEKKIMDNLI